MTKESFKQVVDSEGNPLTPEQVSFFANSKVRDDKGNLLVVYHGSQNKGWNTFVYKPGSASGRLDFGRAFYFTDDKEKATGYSYDFYKSSDPGDLRVCYLNLVNPLIVDAQGMGVKTTYDEATKQMKDYVDKHKDVLSIVSYPYEVYMHMAKSGGHDGIIVNNIIDNPSGEPRPIDVYIAFQANQIKAISNKKPSSKNNINESDKIDIKQQIKDIIKTGDFGQYLPEFLYHATFSGTLDSIKKNGLGSLKSGYKSLWNLQYEQGVYLDTDAGSAESFVEGSDDDRLDTESVVVFKIPTARLDHSLLEVDWNNTWNTDIIEDGEFESLKDYFDSITYFYGGVIPFADLTVVKDLNEEQEESGIEAIAPTKENIIDAAKEEFGSGEDIPEGTPSYLLPDGSFIDMFSESEASEKSYLSSHYGWSHAQVDIFLKHAGLMSSASSEDLSIAFEDLTGSIAVTWSPYEDDAFIFLNNNTPTSQQYEKILRVISNVVSVEGQELKIYTPKLGKINSSQLENKSAKEILDLIKQYYTTGKLGESILKEDIDHREVYKSLTFSDNPERGPIFISKEGKFANIGRFVTHAKIFDGQDYEGDDYYVLHDAFDLIKANGGNRFEPFAYIDLWKVPNPAQKKAIISWMYYLIEWGIYELMVNTSNSNETYNLTTKIPEDTYDDITRGLLESKTEAVGHRNDEFFGDGQRSLLRVVVHETTELGNIDIPDTVLNTFKHTEEQGKLLKEFIELIDSGDPIEDFDVYIETLMDVIHGEYPEAKYALWLCKTKDDVKKLYGGTDSNIGTYKIEYPKPISNLGEEGLLYVFSKLPERING